MISSGIQLGAWDFLKWKNVKPVTENEGKVIGAKLEVYSGDVEEYYTFITPEAYSVLQEGFLRGKDYWRFLAYARLVADNKHELRCSMGD